MGTTMTIGRNPLATVHETAYEAVFIIDAAYPEEQVNTVVEKYKGVITNQGGTIDDVDRWEPRRLAYEIKRRREGVYFVVNFTGTPAVKDELSRIFHISDDVLRHIIVKQHPKADRYPSRIRAAEQERREREAAARAAAQPAVTPVAVEPVTDLSATPEPEGVSTENAPVDVVEETTPETEPTATEPSTETSTDAAGEA
jgi:small subunit ribosomal protein S6